MPCLSTVEFRCTARHIVRSEPQVKNISLFKKLINRLKSNTEVSKVLTLATVYVLKPATVSWRGGTIPAVCHVVCIHRQNHSVRQVVQVFKDILYMVVGDAIGWKYSQIIGEGYGEALL